MSPFTQNNPLLKAWQVAAEKPAEEGGHLLLDMHPVAQARCFRRICLWLEIHASKHEKYGQQVYYLS